jgi:hypothetical protein
MRKVCCALDVSRSHVHKRLKQGNQKRLTKVLTEEDMRLLSLIRDITDKRPTYGYRRVTALLKKKNQENVNHKRVYRVMRQTGLRIQTG